MLTSKQTFTKGYKRLNVGVSARIDDECTSFNFTLEGKTVMFTPSEAKAIRDFLNTAAIDTESSSGELLTRAQVDVVRLNQNALRSLCEDVTAVDPGQFTWAQVRDILRDCAECARAAEGLSACIKDALGVRRYYKA